MLYDTESYGQDFQKASMNVWYPPKDTFKASGVFLFLFLKCRVSHPLKKQVPMKYLQNFCISKNQLLLL